MKRRSFLKLFAVAPVAEVLMRQENFSKIVRPGLDDYWSRVYGTVG